MQNYLSVYPYALKRCCWIQGPPTKGLDRTSRTKQIFFFSPFLLSLSFFTSTPIVIWQPQSHFYHGQHRRPNPLRCDGTYTPFAWLTPFLPSSSTCRLISICWPHLTVLPDLSGRDQPTRLVRAAAARPDWRGSDKLRRGPWRSVPTCLSYKHLILSSLTLTLCTVCLFIDHLFETFSPPWRAEAVDIWNVTIPDGSPGRCSNTRVLSDK